MKKIVFFIDSLESGGAERVTSLLANEFSKRNYIVTLAVADACKRNYFIDENIKVIEIWKMINKEKYLIYYTKKLSCVSHIVKKNDIIISLSMPQTNFYISLAAKMYNKFLILSERNDPANYPEVKILRPIRDFTYFISNRVVFQTQDAKKYFNYKIQAKGCIIPNPIVDSLPEPYKGKKLKKIVNFCRLEPQKNLILLISAFKKFKIFYSDYILEIYGSGLAKTEIENYIYNERLQECVYLYPSDKNIHEKVKNASMFVSSSNYEGISNSMIEAMALGIPTICTNCPVGGARMMIQTGENGILVPVNNENALCNAMKLLAGDEKLSLKISMNAVHIRSKLRIDKVVDMWEEVVKSENK